MTKTYIIPIELELPVDEEGLTTEGWNLVSQFQDAMLKLHDDYGWQEIKRIGNPKRKEN